MRHAHIDRVTRQVVGYGLGLTPTDQWDVVELDDDQLERLAEPGVKTLEDDGTVSVEPPTRTQTALPGRPLPVVITGSRTTDTAQILAKLLDAVARGVPIINQTRV